MTKPRIELTTTLEGRGQPAFDPGSLAELAAHELGCEHARLIGVRGPTEVIIDQNRDAAVLLTRYTWITDWEEHVVIAQEPPKVPETKVEWPDIKLARGARWHGVVPDKDGKPTETHLISNGNALVALDSAEGRAIEASLAEGV